MNDYRFTLEKGSRKHHCPACGKKSFVRYIDNEKGNYLPEQYGRCDRESKCSYHLNPYHNGYATEQTDSEAAPQMPKKWKTPQRAPQPVYFDIDIFKHTLEPERYEKNIFIQNLLKNVQFPFDTTDIVEAIRLYRIGTIAKGYRAGAITFPFIDINNNVRAIQVKQFDEQNHTTGTDFLHSMLEKHHTRNSEPLPAWLRQYTAQEKRISCLFGEHLLSKYPRNPVALVEAPKTAIYGSLYFGFPDNEKSLIWLAVYNKSSFSFDKIQALKGRDVFVFPDLSKDGSTFTEWQNKAKDFEKRLPGTRFVFSDLLEKLAPERDKSEGNDLADYLIKQDWRAFRKQKPTEHKPLQEIQPLVNVEADDFNPFNQPTAQAPNTWSNEITELETFFNKIKLPTDNIKLNDCSMITDANKFVSSHLNSVKTHNGNDTYLGSLHRLQAFKEILNTQIN
jgi:hypothetical protein